MNYEGYVKQTEEQWASEDSKILTFAIGFLTGASTVVGALLFVLKGWW